MAIELFLERFPQGRIEAWSSSQEYISRMFLIGKLAASQQKLGRLPGNADEWKSVPLEPLGAIGGSPFLPQSFVDVAFTLFSPFVNGFGVYLRGGFLAFHFGEAQDVRTKHPASPEHWMRHDLWSESRPGIPLKQRIEDASAARPYLRPVDSDTWFNFWNAYVRTLNVLLERLSSPWEFSANGEQDVVRQFKSLKTLTRISELTHGIGCHLPESLLRFSLFDAGDMYASMTMPNDFKRQADEFKRRFSLEYFERATERVRIEFPIETVYSEEARNLAEATHQSLADGFLWGAPSAGEDGEPERLNVLRWLRNSRHGFFLDRDGTERYLIRHSGNLPSTIVYWAYLWWLELLSTAGSDLLRPEFVAPSPD